MLINNFRKEISEYSNQGHVEGIIPEKEGLPSYIDEAIEMGLKVKVDILGTKNGLYSSKADSEDHLIDDVFLTKRSTKLLICTRSIDVLYHLLIYRTFLDIYYETNSDIMLTTQRYIVTRDEKLYSPRSILITDKEKLDKDVIKNFWGVVSNGAPND